MSDKTIGIILALMILLFTLELITGLVTYALGTILITLSNILLKIGLHAKYL